MELAQAQEVKAGEGNLALNELRARAAGFVLQLSYLSLGAMIVLIPLRYRLMIQPRVVTPVYPDYTDLLLFLADIPLAITLALWLASLGLKPRRVSLRPVLLTYPLAGLVAFSAASSLSSAAPLISAYHAAKLLLLFGLYLYLLNELHSLSLLVIAAGLQILVQATVGVAQVLRQGSLGLTRLQELPLDPAWQGVSIVWTSGTRSLRAYGLTTHPNLLGGCLAFGLVLLAVGYLQVRPAWRPWLGGLFGLGVLALLLTFSRSAWLALLLSLACLGMWTAASRLSAPFFRLVGLCAGTGLLLLPFLLNSAAFLGSRLNLDGSFSANTPENQAVNERTLLVTLAYAMIRQHPLTGVGIGAYPEALRIAQPDYPFDYQPPHLVPLEVAVETGLPGAGLYVLALVAPWVLLWRSREKWITSAHSLSLAGLSAALLAIGVVSLLDYYPWLLNPGKLWQWLLWGAWGSAYIRATRR